MRRKSDECRKKSVKCSKKKCKKKSTEKIQREIKREKSRKSDFGENKKKELHLMRVY